MTSEEVVNAYLYNWKEKPQNVELALFQLTKVGFVKQNNNLYYLGSKGKKLIEGEINGEV
jgi:hypothetical protein